MPYAAPKRFRPQRHKRGTMQVANFLYLSLSLCMCACVWIHLCEMTSPVIHIHCAAFFRLIDTSFGEFIHISNEALVKRFNMIYLA